MGQFIEDLHYKIKTSSSSLALAGFKIFIGLVIGLTFALVGQQMVGYGTFSFLLVIITALAAFFRVSKGWKWSQAFVCVLICTLLAVLLRMYIMIAPGA